jgi:hypothetical protein
MRILHLRKEQIFLKINKKLIFKLFILGLKGPHLIGSPGNSESENLFCIFLNSINTQKTTSNLGLFAVHKLSPNTRKESMRTWSRR